MGPVCKIAAWVTDGIIARASQIQWKQWNEICIDGIVDMLYVAQRHHLLTWSRGKMPASCVGGYLFESPQRHSFFLAAVGAFENWQRIFQQSPWPSGDAAADAVSSLHVVQPDEHTVSCRGRYSAERTSSWRFAPCILASTFFVEQNGNDACVGIKNAELHWT